MRALYVLARLRAMEVLRSKSAAGFFLALPLGGLVVIALVFANGHPFERRRVAIVGEAGGVELTRYDELRVDRVDDRERAVAMLRTRMVSAVLVRSPGGDELLVGPREELFARGLASVVSPAPRITRVPVPRWGYVHYLFPGIVAFALLLGGLFGMGYAMVRDRQSLLLKKLATTPLSRATFVGAQIVARTGLILAQMALLVAAAVLLFELPISLVSLAWLALVITLGVLVFLGVGFLIACVVKSEAVMMDIISTVNLPLVFLSEMFFPLDALPDPLARVGEVLPSTILVRAIRELVLTPHPAASSLLPSVLALAGWALALFAISAWRFRWHE